MINESFTSLAAGEYEFEVSLNTTGRYNWRNAVYDGADVYFVEPGVGGGGIASYDITLVPEPSAMLLAGFAGVLVIRRKR